MLALETRVELWETSGFYWHAFTALSRQRTASMNGPNPISASDIEAWLNIHGIADVDDRLETYQLISAMDFAWLEVAAARMSEKKEADTPSSNRRKGSDGRRK